MAEYKFGCPQCGQHIQCTDAYIGRQINCPTCQKAIIVARPKGAVQPPAIQSAPVAANSGPPVWRIAVISAVAFGLCVGLSIGGWNYFAQQRAQKRELEQAQQKTKQQAQKRPNGTSSAQAGPATNDITASALTLVSGSTLQVHLDINNASAPASLSVESPRLGTLNLDINSTASITGQTLSLKKTLTFFNNATINVSGDGTDTLELGSITMMSESHTPYFNLNLNAPAGGPGVMVSKLLSGNWGDYLNIHGGGNVTVTGNLTNGWTQAGGGSWNVFVYDGSTLTLQGATTKGMPAGRGGGDPYRYSVVNGTLVLDNNNSLINNNPTGTGFNQAWFLLGAATSVFSPTINGRATPAPGVLVDTDNSFNATVYLGDANYPDGGLSVSADLPTHLSDGDAGFVNRGVFTIGGQNTNGINTYNNSIILGLTANVGKSVTLVAATGGEVDFAGGLLANGDDKTAGVTVGDAAHGGIVKLTATNTYGGNTFITNGTLALGGAGSIVKSGSIVLAGGTTFDVSGLSHAFNLGSGQTLSNKAPTARLNGNVNTGPGIVSLTYASGTPSLTVSNGTLNLAKMTVFKVNNTGTALASGSYKIISAQITGRITALTGLPAVSVGGGGIAADGTAALQITRGELYLVVKGNASPESAF